MPSDLPPRRFYGYTADALNDRDGRLLGKVTQAFSDTDKEENWEVQWLRVRLPDGESGEVFVPATGGTNIFDQRGRLTEERVAFTQKQVLAAPRCRTSDVNQPPDSAEEAALYKHYFPI
jgi:hypothetical protein